jgi:hypothetical protein
VQDHQKMINLVSRCNNFYEKRDTEMRFAVTCSSTRKVFLNMHVRDFCVKTKCCVFSVLVKLYQHHNTGRFKISYSWMIQISGVQPFLIVGHSDTSDLVKCHNGFLKHNVNTLKH